MSQLIVPILALAAVACGAIDGLDDVGSSARGLYVNTSYMLSGNPVSVPVCWENPQAGTTERRNWARDAVRDSWQRYARVNFTGWGTCQAGDAGVHVKIKNWGQSSAPNGGIVTLNLWNGDGSQASVQAVTRHEFGHVLGFYHEEERPDYDGSGIGSGACAKQSWPNSNPQYYGAYDVGSIMSYCGGTGNLSPGDIAAVQRAYGRRIGGTLVSPTSGKCLAAHAHAWGDRVAFLWDCDERYDDQEWRRSGSALYLTAQYYPWMPPRCLQNLYGAGQYAQAAIGSCNTPGASWAFDSVRMRGWGGLCLDLQNGNTTNGTNIQMWQCGALGGANQRWTVTTAGQIKYGGPRSNKCLTTNGSSVYIYTCGLVFGQQFDFLASGQIRPKVTPGFYHFANRCLDVQGWLDSEYLAGNGLPKNGTNVQLFPCLSNQTNQKWNLNGPLRHTQTGLCLQRTSDENGGVPRLRTCNNNPQQDWDYYFK